MKEKSIKEKSHKNIQKFSYIVLRIDFLYVDVII